MVRSAWAAMVVFALGGGVAAASPGASRQGEAPAPVAALEKVLASDAPAPGVAAPVDSREVELGRALYFDPGLSRPAGRACASCHDPAAGFSDPDHARPASTGAVSARTGTRNAPTAGYARFSPPFHYDQKAGTYVGGLFWDGRADSLEAQAAGPLLNPAEMNEPDAAAVIATVRGRPYAPLFREVFGAAALDDPQLGLADLTRAIAAFERSRTFAPFTSKYDAYLEGRATLNAEEARGLAIFEDPKKGNCAACHPSRPGPVGRPPLFTDFSYDNLGVPGNPKLGGKGPDLGLGARLGRASEDGKFKVPTLRNVALTAPYMHNGYFASLEEVVHFYNTRDVGHWPAAEVPDTVNHKELGDLHLTADEEQDLVAFLGTLTDGFTRPPLLDASRAPVGPRAIAVPAAARR